ncbi:MAG: NAD-dependent epimerase/dehydratase family protein [Victivallaceae bacterium]|nr:hypothetical protein [Victivallaceae bacterium]
MLPEKIGNEGELETLLSVPQPGMVELMKRLDGDIMILGIAGKMGVTMGRQAVEAIRAAGVDKKVYGVARFSDAAGFENLAAHGIEPIRCDLLDNSQVAQLPKVKNIIFMAGRKFGTEGAEAQTWAMNILAPFFVCDHFRNSRITVFSTGCVYPLVGPENGGCSEDVNPEPVGEYSQSCLGRERILEYGADKFGTKLLFFRLNYAIDLRYGVLHDIAQRVWHDLPVSRSVSHFNVIWQGEANAFALRSLELADNPPAILNVTGGEMIAVEDIAEAFGKAFGKKVTYEGTPSGQCYLSDASKCFRLLGGTAVPLDWMIARQAEWLIEGGRSLGKPTHFEVNNGKF